MASEQDVSANIDEDKLDELLDAALKAEHLKIACALFSHPPTATTLLSLSSSTLSVVLVVILPLFVLLPANPTSFLPLECNAVP